MPQNPVRWFEIYVQDMSRAKKFYETVFDLKLTKLNSPVPDLEMWQFPANQEGWGCPGALAKMKNAPSGGMGTIVYFGSEDCSVEEKRVVKAGGKIHGSKMPIGQHGFIALIVDTEGNIVGIHSMK